MRNIIFIITLLMSVMLFTTNPIDSSFRLYQAIWSTGHLFFFALLVWIMVTSTSLYKQSWLRIFWFCLAFAFLLGGLIEVLQLMVGRYMEWQDVFTDVLGALLGFLIVVFLQPLERRPINRPVVSLFSLIVLLIAFYPVYNVFKDNQKVEKEFPIIANFESETDLSRWDNKHVKRFEIDREIHIEGDSSALIEFKKAKYPNVSLQVIYPNWSAYRGLNIHIHNGQGVNLPIELKIYDELHQLTGYEYKDRFNLEVNLKPGWNALKIYIQDIIDSPSTRKMDISKIKGFSLFLEDTKGPKVIHLDNIHLSH